MRYETQFIDTFSMGLAMQLSAYQEDHPQAKLVTVMPVTRNPGESEKYRAVWDYSQSDISREGKS